VKQNHQQLYIMAREPKLRIAEHFYSLQGEGRTMGIPSVFIRLQACNILCDGEWTCDTIEVWKKGEGYTIDKFLVLMRKYLPYLRDGAHLIFTGGEPLIQQKSIEWAIRCFKRVYGFKPYIEIETNGTIIPMDELIPKIDLFNCSFKLKNSGVKYERRIKYDALKKLNTYNTIFKIVISNEQDFAEAENILTKIGVDNKDIYLMPAGDNIDDLMKTNPIVADICIKKALNFSTRLQIVLWNKTVGV